MRLSYRRAAEDVSLAACSTYVFSMLTVTARLLSISLLFFVRLDPRFNVLDPPLSRPFTRLTCS